MSDLYSSWAAANLKVIIPLAYAIPLLLFYIVIIVVILIKLDGPFYRLFAVCGITDISLWLLTFALRRAKTAPLFFKLFKALPAQGAFVTFVVFAYYYVLLSQFFATFFLIASRFTAAVVPLRHAKLWTRFIWLAYVTIALLPLPLTWNIWFCECRILLENPSNMLDGYRWSMTNEECGANRTNISVLTEIIHLFLVLLMNDAIFVRMYQLRRKLEAFSEAKDDRRDSELKLLLLTCVLLVYFVVNVVIEALFYFSPHGLADVLDLLFTVQALALDFHALAAPVFLVLMSTAVRQELSSFIDVTGTRNRITFFKSRQRHTRVADTNSAH